MRNPQENFKFATIKNSVVAQYFKRQVELSSLYKIMEKHNYDSVERAIHDVKEGWCFSTCISVKTMFSTLLLEIVFFLTESYRHSFGMLQGSSMKLQMIATSRQQAIRSEDLDTGWLWGRAARGLTKSHLQSFPSMRVRFLSEIHVFFNIEVIISLKRFLRCCFVIIQMSLGFHNISNNITKSRWSTLLMSVTWT